MLVRAENAGLVQLLGTTISYSTGRDTKGIAVALHGRRRDTYCAGQAPAVAFVRRSVPPDRRHLAPGHPSAAHWLVCLYA